MIPRDAFINLLRSKGYRYKDQTVRIQLWRRPQPLHEVVIRRKEDPLSEEYVRSVLKQCGLDAAEIEQFIGGYRTH